MVKQRLGLIRHCDLEDKNGKCPKNCNEIIDKKTGICEFKWYTIGFRSLREEFLKNNTKRLTPKKKERDKINFSVDWQTDAICLAHSIYEDYEEKIGAKFLKVFEALEKGYYAKDGSGVIRVISTPGITYSHDLYFCQADQKFHIYSENVYGTQVDNLIENYGKTWALTKEELEVSSIAGESQQ